jgi:hypothetical protein
MPPREIVGATGVAPTVSIESSAKFAGIEKASAERRRGRGRDGSGTRGVDVGGERACFK